MSYLPYRPEPLDSAIVGDRELSLEEQGAFLNLKREMWRANGSLPNDSYILAQLSGAGRRWPRIARALQNKLAVVNDRVFIEEISTMLRLAIERRAKAAKAGLAAVLARHGNVHADFASSKPLNYHNRDGVAAGPKLAASGSNENKSLINSKTQRPRDAAASRRSREAYYEGHAKVLAERTGMRVLAAHSQISRWLSATGGDEAELNSILDAGMGENLRGRQLIAVIDQRVASRNRERKKGLPLPFPPGLVINSGQ
jgi:uncharacterized protein YdaU (DUF1376 family)